MRGVHRLPFETRRVVLWLVSASSALIVSCGSSGSTTRSGPVHCAGDGDCLNGQVCDGNVCTAVKDVDTGAPSKPMAGTGGRRSTGTCGDGIAEGGEACDGSDLRGESCATATSNPAVVGALGCTSTCAFDLRSCRISADAGFLGRGGVGGTFGFGGAAGSAAGAGAGGTVGLSPPVPCGNSACPDPLSSAPPSQISTLKQSGSFPSACCLDASTNTCGTMFSGGSCEPIPPPDPTCPTAGSSLPAGATYPCCVGGQCGLSLYGTTCLSLTALMGIGSFPSPVACGSLDAGAFGAQP